MSIGELLAGFGLEHPTSVPAHQLKGALQELVILAYFLDEQGLAPQASEVRDLIHQLAPRLLADRGAARGHQAQRWLERLGPSVDNNPLPHAALRGVRLRERS